MKNALRIEEAFQFIFGIYLFHQLNYAWWWFPALLLLPDISMIGYLINPKWGAVLYNIAHHKGNAILIYLLGIYLASPTLQLVGIILFSHSVMDRIMGYGLKYSDSFQHTHLGMIGKNHNSSS